MSILIENNKLVAIIENGERIDFRRFTEAINSAINFYLCRSPYRPITEHQAGYIYFLKVMGEHLRWKTSLQSENDQGRIICEIPRNDLHLLQIFTESIDGFINDILDSESQEDLGIIWSDVLCALTSLRKAFNPSNYISIKRELLQKN